MPRYKVRTLLILMAVGPPIMAGVWPFIRMLFIGREADDLDQFRVPFNGMVELYEPRAAQDD